MNWRSLSLITIAYVPALFGTSVKEERTSLRAGCSADASLIETLPAGAPVTLKFALSGETVPCYKVAVDISGRRVDGYLPASAIEGLDRFDKDRKSAVWVDIKPTGPQNLATSSSSPAAQAARGIRVRGTASALHAKELLEAGRVDEALSIIDSENKRHPDAGLLAMAGIAAMQSDQNRRALDYFKASLDLEQDEAVAKAYQQLLREVNADQSITKLYGINAVLRFDSGSIPVDTAREILGTVDASLLNVSQQLGCRTDEKLITIAQSWESYKQARNVVEWSGGMFDGRIRVPMDKGKPLSDESRKTLTHEATHACLSTFGHLPQWLHEGLAQKLSGEALPPQTVKVMTEMAHSGSLAPLESLGHGWGGLTSQQARYAYAEALMAVDLLFKDFGNDGVRNLLRNPDRIPAISAELDKRLAQ